jgi:hypothetical protein
MTSATQKVKAVCRRLNDGGAISAGLILSVLVQIVKRAVEYELDRFTPWSGGNVVRCPSVRDV